MANISAIKLPNGATYNLVDKTSGYITNETDPTVPSWAKASSKPSYTASEISGLLDFFYPVGSYYETSDDTFDPNVTWGGTWYKETEGQVHISSGSQYAVTGADTTHYIGPETVVGTSDGGSADAIIPYHNHTASGTAVTKHSATACTIGTKVGVTVAAHTITQPTFTGPSHTHGTGSDSYNRWVVTNTTDSLTNEAFNSLSGSTYRLPKVQSSAGFGTRSATASAGTGACTRTTNVALTNNHSVTVTQPTFNTPELTHSVTQPTISYAGTNGNTVNANMQPFIIVHRWHRVA